MAYSRQVRQAIIPVIRSIFVPSFNRDAGDGGDKNFNIFYPLYPVHPCSFSLRAGKDKKYRAIIISERLVKPGDLGCPQDNLAVPEMERDRLKSGPRESRFFYPLQKGIFFVILSLPADEVRLHAV
jgi:hypothetical protein